MDDTSQSPSVRPPRHAPYSGARVYATLAAVALGIIAIIASCCGTWLYYVAVRGQR